ncbi:TPA: hypothetical protein DIC40_00620 [Patescibacteria group bacterium]|nr:hypothetical protein P148_SR1C00001G0969 [candidate division SR1 bacterium RAAC1_SR1_1]HCY20381.1 hypothetical protein [Candidatus Gracilibacteria bacterium]
MITKIGFNAVEVQNAAAEYEKVELPKEYRELMDGISRIMSPFVDMSDMAIRGFIFRAIIEWQKRKNKKVAIVLDLSPQERQQMMKQGLDILQEMLAKILKTPSDKQKLQKAVDMAYSAYLHKLMPKKS